MRRRPTVCVRVLRLIEFLQNDIYGLSHCLYACLYTHIRVRLPGRRRSTFFFYFRKSIKGI